MISVLVLLATALLHPPVVAADPSATAPAPGPSPSVRRLTLTEARDLALANDEQIRQAGEAVNAADAQARNARAGRLPHLDLSAAYTRNLKKPAFFLPADMAAGFGGQTQIEMGGDYDLQGALSLTWNLWTAGRLSAAAGAADATTAATAWQKALVQDAVLYGVDAAYYELLLAEANVAIAASALDAAAEAHRVTAAAHEQGTASRFDLLRARVELANREAPLVQARNLRDLAMLQLARRCGLESGTVIEPGDELAVVPAPAGLDSLLDAMRAGSPELQSLRHQVAARNQAVRLARAGRGPVVQLQGTYAVQGQWDDDPLPGGDETVGSASAALAVSIPLFDGFAARTDIARAGADLRGARAELERITRDRELGVRQARVNLVNAMTALEGRHESVELAEEAHRLALVRLENGLATPLERLDAELALTDARTQLASALYSCNVARSALTLAVGTHTAPDVPAQEVR